MIGEGGAPIGEKRTNVYDNPAANTPFLGLDGVAALTYEAIEELSKFKGKLSLSRIVESLTKLSSNSTDVALAQLLATRTHDAVGLEFDALRSLSKEAGAELAKYEGRLGLTALSATDPVLDIFRSRPRHSTILPAK